MSEVEARHDYRMARGGRFSSALNPELHLEVMLGRLACSSRDCRGLARRLLLMVVLVIMVMLGQGMPRVCPCKGPLRLDERVQSGGAVVAGRRLHLACNT